MGDLSNITQQLLSGNASNAYDQLNSMPNLSSPTLVSTSVVNMANSTDSEEVRDLAHEFV